MILAENSLLQLVVAVATGTTDCKLGDPVLRSALDRRNEHEVCVLIRRKVRSRVASGAAWLACHSAHEPTDSLIRRDRVLGVCVLGDDCVLGA